MRQGIELHWSGYRHPQTQGKVERFHGSLQRAQQRRGVPEQQRQQWLDQYRHEYNHVRPHQALGMQTPASRWSKSARTYDPRPSPWQYREGARVVKVGSQGQIWTEHRRWEISYALAGQWVELARLEDRVLVYHCRTEFPPKCVKDVLEQNVNHVLELDTPRLSCLGEARQNTPAVS